MIIGSPNNFFILFGILLASLSYVEPQLEPDYKPLCTAQTMEKSVFSPMSCSAYFFCSTFGPEEKFCADGLWFNGDSEKCEPQANVECDIQFNEPMEDGLECPYEDDPNTMLFRPSRVSCSRYYICYMRNPSMLLCKAGLWWNQAKLMCDDPENVDCKLMNDVDIDTDVITTTTLKTTVQFECPRNGTAHIPHPEHCNWFVYCRNGSSSVQQCQFMQHFDVDSRQCKFKFTAKCAIPIVKEKI